MSRRGQPLGATHLRQFAEELPSNGGEFEADANFDEFVPFFGGAVHGYGDDDADNDGDCDEDEFLDFIAEFVEHSAAGAPWMATRTSILGYLKGSRKRPGQRPRHLRREPPLPQRCVDSLGVLDGDRGACLCTFFGNESFTSGQDDFLLGYFGCLPRALRRPWPPPRHLRRERGHGGLPELRRL